MYWTYCRSGMQAREAYEQAIELRPNYCNVLGRYSTLKWSPEKFGDAVHLAEKAVALDSGNVDLRRGSEWPFVY